MNKIDMALNQLVEAVMDSTEYKEYIKNLEEVKKYPDLKRKIDEFRQRNFDIQSTGDFTFEKLEKFKLEYSSFRENPMVSNFLASELAFCRLMQEINLELTDAMNFE